MKKILHERNSDSNILLSKYSLDLKVLHHLHFCIPRNQFIHIFNSNHIVNHEQVRMKKRKRFNDKIIYSQFQNINMSISYISLFVSSFSGTGYDRWSYEQSSHLAGANDNALNKLQHKFWVTKTKVVRKLGKEEDKEIVASDAELDAKLELFQSIHETTCRLEQLLELYQDRLCRKYSLTPLLT